MKAKRIAPLRMKRKESDTLLKKAFPLYSIRTYLDPLRGTRAALILSNKESRMKLGILLPHVFVISVSQGQFSEEMRYALCAQKKPSTGVQIADLWFVTVNIVASSNTVIDVYSMFLRNG